MRLFPGASHFFSMLFGSIFKVELESVSELEDEFFESTFVVLSKVEVLLTSTSPSSFDQKVFEF